MKPTEEPGNDDLKPFDIPGLAGGMAHPRESDLTDQSAGLDADFARLVESVTHRLQSGEAIDERQLAREYPQWSADLRSLLPTLRGLAELKGMAESLTPRTSEVVSREPGRLLGAYRIIREIGRGGMGVVYEAEQRALGRRVAIKILPLAAAIDPRTAERFQLEARVIGLLQHPRIVSIYEVGRVEEIPYYSMQYVDGGSLADLLAELRGSDRSLQPTSLDRSSSLVEGLVSGCESTTLEGLSTGLSTATTEAEPDKASPRRIIETPAYYRAVARLGVHVAEALGYAHSQGVIHRDIKPANLLLDRSGSVWVADFGMADIQGDAGLTMTGDLPGTLRYMSPEQAQGKRALVDRRTDVYSLGATLYELLTLNRLVHGTDRQEIFRGIIDGEPTPIRRLNPAIPIDLAKVVAKSISREPSGRYETAEQFADDLKRFLNGLPIQARPIGRLARTARWARRNPIPSTLAASLCLALILGFAGVTWSWREAVRERGLHEAAETEAREQAAIAQSINRFLLEKVLGKASPENNPDSANLTLLEVLDQAASDVGTSFPGQPRTEAEIRLTVGRAYHGLGQYSKSESHLRIASQLFRQEMGETGVGTLESDSELGHILSHQGRFEEAERLLVRTTQEAERALGHGSLKSLTALEYLAQLELDQGRFASAEQKFRSCLTEALKAPVRNDELVFSTLNNLGLSLVRQKKFKEASNIFEDLIVASKRIRGIKHPGTISALNNQGTILEQQGDYARAEPIFRECLELNCQSVGPKHRSTLVVQHNLAKVLQGLGRLDESEKLFRDCMASQQQCLGKESPDSLFTMGALASLLRQRGQLDEAEALLRSCLESQTRLFGADHPSVRQSQKRLNNLLAERAKTSTPEPHLEASSKPK